MPKDKYIQMGEHAKINELHPIFQSSKVVEFVSDPEECHLVTFFRGDWTVWILMFVGEVKWPHFLSEYLTCGSTQDFLYK